MKKAIGARDCETRRAGDILSSGSGPNADFMAEVVCARGGASGVCKVIQARICFQHFSVIFFLSLIFMITHIIVIIKPCTVQAHFCSQASVGAVLLFIGIVMQLWASYNVSDIPLSTLCEAYSGAGDAMSVDDFNALFNWWDHLLPPKITFIVSTL